VEQALKLKKALPFIVAGLSTIAAKFLVGDRGTIIVGLLMATIILVAGDRKGVSDAERR
jgi:hypothetical protein